MNQAGHGGKRPGAGRRKGSLTKRTREVAEKAAEEGVTPLEYMLNVMRSELPDGLAGNSLVAAMSLRFEAAKAAAPYMHPRLAAVEMSGPNGGPIEGRTTLDVSGLNMEQLRALASIRLNGE